MKTVKKIPEPDKIIETKIPSKHKFAMTPALIFLLISIAAAGVALFSYWLTLDPTRLGQPLSKEEDVKRTVAAVGKLMLLPTDESPTVAMVGDITKLASQPFFARAQNGDKVLLYNTKKQAILYRPTTNVIIEVAPINVSLVSPIATQSAVIKVSPSPETTKTAEVQVFLFNGAGVNGLTKTYETKLKAAFPQMKVVDRDNAKGSYDKTVIIDLTKTKSADIDTYAKKLGITVSALPDGETAPKADVLIIVGKDAIKN